MAQRSPKPKRGVAETDSSLSPPPLKRKAVSAISKSAVAAFFTPTSQKPKERTLWSERSPDGNSPTSLLVARYTPEKEGEGLAVKKRKIAAFDLDSTLITTASGKKHADAYTDWQWWDVSVPTRLRALVHDEDYLVTIFTNQAGLTLHPDPKVKAPKNAIRDRISAFKQKCNAVLTQLDIPLTVYAATGKDIFRKPRSGMWTELLRDYGLVESEIDLENSIFIGDAGGRTARMRNGAVIASDFSCSDRNFAHNVGIRYQSPEEFFLGEKSRTFSRDFDLAKYPFVPQQDNTPAAFRRSSSQDIVLFCGPPGAGKSTFYWKYLQPLGYKRVNQDILKSREKCLKTAEELLRDGESVVVDNTNSDVEVRASWISLARKHNVPIRCVLFKTPVHVAEHNDAVRSLNKMLNPEAREVLPKLAFNTFASRFQVPKVKEGFQDIVELDFVFRGSKEEYDIWGHYWL